MTQQDETKKEPFFTAKDRRTMLKIAAVVVGLWLVSWGFIALWDRPTNAGTFGDQFGAINSLFSGLAFGGVIFALFKQMEEARDARVEEAKAREFQQKALNLQTQLVKAQERLLDLEQQLVSAQGEQTTMQARSAKTQALTALVNVLGDEIIRDEETMSHGGMHNEINALKVRIRENRTARTSYLNTLYAVQAQIRFAGIEEK